jgi:hypothetical protein
MSQTYVQKLYDTFRLYFIHQGLTLGMNCRLVNIHKSNIYCTITTTYIDNRKACESTPKKIEFLMKLRVSA